MNIAAISGLLMTASLLMMAILFGSPLIVFFDLPSLLLVTAVTVFMLAAAHGADARLLVNGLGRWLMPGSIEPWSPKACRKVAHIANSGGSMAVMAGALGCLTGLVQMLQNLDDPAAIGPAMAVALLTVFYAVALNLLFFVPMARFFTNEAAGDEAAG